MKKAIASLTFVACTLLVLAARELRKILMRDENYYGEEDYPDE